MSIASGQEDLYGVFVARASLMGWSIQLGKSNSPLFGENGDHPVLWGMNEAELTAGESDTQVGWVQVGLAVEPARALPPMLECFDAALRHFGEINLSALQVNGRDLPPDEASSAWDLVHGRQWFDTSRGPGAKAIIAWDERFLQDQTEDRFAESLQQWNGPAMPWNELKIAFGSLVETSDEQAIDPVELAFRPRLTPAERGVMVELPEWSALAAAWAMAIVIEMARRDGPAAANFAIRITRLD